MAHKVHGGLAQITWRVVLLAAAICAVAAWPLTCWVAAAVDLSVGIPQLDGDVALQLILEPDSMHP